MANVSVNLAEREQQLPPREAREVVFDVKGLGVSCVDSDGKKHTVRSTGTVPFNATFNAIKQLIPHEAKLALFQVHAVTEGTDAQAEVSVRLEEDGRAVTGRGADTDTLVASARAYVAALNKLAVKREKTARAQAAV